MIRGLIFDVNGTLTDILTNESYEDIYRTLGNFLDYQGVSISPDELKRLYFEINKRQRRTSAEQFPEFDAVAIFREILETHASEYTRNLPSTRLELLPAILAEIFRAASRFKLCLYPGVWEVMSDLRDHYQLAALSDGQTLWAIPELRSVGLLDFFKPVIVSSDLGYRKPDRRMFELALSQMQLSADEVLFVGNDMYRDVFGAHELGIKTVFFKSNQGEQKSSGAEPDYIIYDFRQLPEAIRFLSGE